MELSYDRIRSILDHTWPDGNYQTASEYGERGYSFPVDATTPLVVLANYWCPCGKVSITRGDYTTDLHGYDHHYPRVWARMEAQGVQFEWSDEWIIDYDNNKAYRTQADSYSWQPSIVWTEDGEFLTPDDDIETWIDWAKNEPTRYLPSRVWSSGDLMMADFRSYNGTYNNGWHEGMTDDPKKITEDIRRWHGDDVEIVFLLDETSQFYIGFSAWIRGDETEDDDDDETKED